MDAPTGNNPASPILWQRLDSTQNVNAPETTPVNRTGPILLHQATKPAPTKQENLKSEWDSMVRNGSSIHQRCQFINKNIPRSQQNSFKITLKTYAKGEEQIALNNERINEINEELTDFDKIIKEQEKGLASFSKVDKVLGRHKETAKALIANTNTRDELLAESKRLMSFNQGVQASHNEMRQNPDFNLLRHFDRTMNLGLQESFVQIKSLGSLASFAQVDLDKITVPGDIDLEAVQPQFIANDTVKSALTCKDPTSDADGTPIFTEGEKDNRGKIDPRFANLHGISEGKAPTNGGAATANAYNATAFSQRSQKVEENVDAQRFCDAFHFENHSQYKLVVLADGSGQQQRARTAAQSAVAGAVGYVNKALQNPEGIVNGNDVKYLLFSGAQAAQEETMKEADGKRNEAAGLTTFSMCFEYQDQDGRTILNNLSVGDSATYVFTKDAITGQNKIINLSAGSRDNDPLNSTDPGGQLGEHVAGKLDSPDLRNISFNAIAIPKDTPYMVMVMSDGITDNLNPYNLGYSVAQARAYVRGEEVKPDLNPDGTVRKWADVAREWKDPNVMLEGSAKPGDAAILVAEQAKLVSEFQAKMMQNLIEKAQADLGPDATTQQIMEKITEHCAKTTEKYRAFLKTGQPDPLDYRTNPGKLDHISIVGYK